MATKNYVKNIVNKQVEAQKTKEAIKTKKDKIKALYDAKEWYTIRAILGNQWAHFFCLIGARERGKTFAVQDKVLNDFFNPNSKLYHQHFYWFRLNDVAVHNMLMNNGAKLIEPLLLYKYHLQGIKVRGDSVFIGDLLLCRVYGLSTAYNLKGAAIFDAKNFKGANIICDEVALEKGQKKTFDVVYNLKMAIENTVRSESENVRIFFMLNNTEECPELLAMFGFIPVEFGVYKLKRKMCVMDYIPNNAAYDKRRKKALANILDTGTGNFTNKIQRDLSLLYKKRLNKPSYIVKFTKDQCDWFTVWDKKIVCPYHGEKVDSIAMKRYIDDYFNPETRDTVIELNDVRAYYFKDILTQNLFYKNLEIIKK